MGNRAVIAQSMHPSAPCIYLHWNGGRASVEGFLAGATDLGLAKQPMDKLTSSDWDNLAEMMASVLDTHVGMTVYREHMGRADQDNWDNGTYLINGALEIVARQYLRHGEEVNPEKTTEIRKACAQFKIAEAA